MSGPVAMELHPDLNKFNLKFLDIFGRIVMEEKLMPKALVEKYGDKVPYDVFFPTQQDKIERRVCVVCGMYFSSIKSITEQHRKVCKPPRVNKRAPKKVTPAKRVAPTKKVAPGKKVAPAKKDAAAKKDAQTKVVVDFDLDESESEGSEGFEEHVLSASNETEEDISTLVADEDDLALNASFLDEENNEDAANIEEVSLEANVSVPSEGGFEVILDLKQWLKSPWSPATET